MKKSPTKRTLEYMESLGYLADVVERRGGSRRTFDLYGMFDVIAIGYGDTIAIQCTSVSNVSARVKKLTENENIGKVRDAGWAIEVHGWRSDGTLRKIDLS